jgi:hypothetical protein
MRNLYCPICASEIEWRPNDFSCFGGASFSPKLGNQIKNAVHAVGPPSGPPRKPEIASYLWCPNCTAELVEHNERERRLLCTSCSLELPVLAHVELMEIRSWHPAVGEEDE